MFLFVEDEVWRQYMDELGIQRVIDNLTAKGYPSGWVSHTVDTSEKYASYLPEGKPWYISACPCYEGYYLLGGTGSVRCRTAGELLPGIVWYGVCSKDYGKCPFYKEAEGERYADMQ